MKPATDSAADAAPQAPEDDNMLVKIRVTVHGTKIGSLVCALGHEQQVSLKTARVLEALKKAEIIGV
jgi:hypothetical protein